MPRTNTRTGKTRHNPLHVQLNKDDTWANYGKVSQPGKRKKSRTAIENDDDAGNVPLDSKTSRRILALAKDQQDELEDDASDDDVPKHEFPRMPMSEDDGDDDDEERESLSEADDAENMFQQIDANDLETMDAMLPTNAGERRTLADIILAKLESGDVDNPMAKKITWQDGQARDPAMGLDPRLVEAYTKVGFLLQSHKLNPLPKLFKVIPTLPAWARLLALTRPENWSPLSCRAATRVFISSMKPSQAQLYLRVVLLDAIRSDIRANKKLNVHYYEALKRALYKPSAFFKGIVFPLLEDASCTLREAVIIASILPKRKVPVLHSSAALLHIANMDYSGPNSLFIRVLIDKKYQLPYKAVDALVFHFIRLSNAYKTRDRGGTEQLPVLWHQSLLAFVQRYASDLTPDQKDALLDVVRVHPHAQIGPEVRRELLSSVTRGEPRPDALDVVMT